MEALFTVIGVFAFFALFMAAGMWFLLDEIGQGVGLLILVGIFVWFIVATV